MNLKRWRFPFLTFFFTIFLLTEALPFVIYHWVLTIRGNAIVPTLQTRNSGSGKKMPC